MAIGAGTDVAIESADVVLIKNNVFDVTRTVHFSRATMSNIRQNLFSAFIYNGLGIPVAAGLLYPFFGVLLSPIIASAAMALSSISVVLNALHLRTFELPSSPAEDAPATVAQPQRGEGTPAMPQPAKPVEQDLKGGEEAMERDPVCRMDVVPEHAAGTSEYQGQTYYFCSPSCKQQFDRQPERYATQ